MLPLLGIGYGIAYIDRVNVSFAALQMNRELHFSASAYGLGAGLFFLSYAACEIPSNLLLVHFGARRWLARIMLTWGLLSIAMMLVRTPREFYFARFALGAAEAGFFPGIIFYLSEWFPAHKRSQAISRFYVAMPLSSVIMGGLAGMLLNLDGRLHLAGWQWLFLVEGLPALLISLLLLFYLPDGPQNARWLKDDERAWILNELKKEAADNRAHSANEIVRALKEPRVWLLGSFLFCLYFTWYSITFVAPSVIQRATGFNATNVGLAIALFGVVGAASMLISGWHSDRTRERYFHTLIPNLGIAVAVLAIALSATPAITLAAFAFLFLFGMATQPPAWSLPTSFLNGKSAAVGIAVVNTIAMCGGFVGPWWIGVAHDITGTYRRGILTLILPLLLGCVLLLIIRYLSKTQTTAGPQQNGPAFIE
ncbi:MAG TPA: MFS transporter [Silvibacterium sp.]|nr:MFS transporter [Silvibacterium sp.]